MRALFYTATAFFIVLAGVFAFYALQGPEHPSGAKVVLSIDSGKAPGAANAAGDAPERDLYAEAAARLQSTDARKSGDNAGGQDVAATDEADAEQPDAALDQQDAAPDNRVDAAAFRAAPDAPPGAALAGLDNDNPLFKNIGEEQKAADGDDVPASAEAEASLPGTQFGTGVAFVDGKGREENLDRAAGLNGPSDQPGASQERKEPTAATGLRPEQAAPSDAAATTAQAEQKTGLNAILAALNEREGQTDGAASPPAAPPPIPLRRSNATAAVNGWGSTKITRSDAATLKPVRIAILLRGLGRDDRNSSDAVTKLPPAVSLAFMPFAGGAQQWARKASEQGHEVIVQLPLEPTDYPVNNPGPETLLASSSADQNTSRLNAILARFEGYSGVTNFLGGRLLQSKDALRPILEDIKSRGLIYIGEGNRNSHALVRGLAGEIGLRYGGANLMIDAQPAPAAIQAALERLITIARKEGSAIGLGYGSKATIEQVQAWAQTLSANGVTLVPVGALAQTPGAS